MDISSLDATVHYFYEHGVAQSTRQTYKSALSKFSEFCSLFGIVSPFPVSESILCYFTSHLAQQNLSSQTIKTYLAGIRHTQISLGLPEPQAFSSLPRLKLVQAGVERTQAERSRKSRVRLPITPAILQKIHDQWSPRAHESDFIMLWAAAILCFFGFFRAGEITIPTRSSFNPHKHLCWQDVAIDNPLDPKMLKVVLKYSKTDQMGRGAEVFIGKTGGTLCPVAGILSYMVVRGNHEGQFFMFQDGQPLTKDKFVKHVRLALQAAGLPYSNFAGHSFRIGAATTAAAAGVEDSTIRTLGRWSSDAFHAYIRMPKESLAQVSPLLAGSCS